MAGRRYERIFSRLSAPYMEAVRLTECHDVAKLRSTARRVELQQDCANVDQLERFKQIERVHCTLRSDWLPYLAELPRLQRAELTLPNESRIPSLACLARLKSLVLLCNGKQTQLNFLRDMTFLRSLCVSEALGVKQLTSLGSLANLHEIYLDGAMGKRHRVKSLAPLAKLTELRYAVILVGSEQQRKPLRHLFPLKRLDYLYLDASFHSNKDDLDEVLRQLPKLKQIEFNGGAVWPPRKRSQI